MPEKIKNVFILMLENHSFDNIFGRSGIPGINGLTGNETNSYNGNSYPVTQFTWDRMPSDPGHEFLDTLEQLCGQDNWCRAWQPGDTYPPPGHTIDNSGFVANYATSITEQTKIVHTSPPPLIDIGDVMSYFDTATQLPAIYELATQFAVCDNWFSSLPGPTWPNRFFAYAASSGSMDDSPSGFEQIMHERFKGYSFPHGSIFDLLKKGNYRLYQDKYSKLSFPIVQALKNIHWSELNDVSSFAEDLKKDYHYPLTLIEPNYGDIFFDTYRGGSSQHPMDGMHNGEALIKTVYEAIYNSPVWENSLLIITYDEHGGFYDHVAPPQAPKPEDGATGLSKHGFDFSRYGVRVPAVIVSPYIPANTVSNVLYDHSSMIKTVTENWGLPSLTNRDKLANSLSPLLTLDKPRDKSDCPSSLKLAPDAETSNFVITQEKLALLDNMPLPDSGNTLGFLQIAIKVDYELGLQTETNSYTQNTVKNPSTMGNAGRYINSVLEKLQSAIKAK
ncbi:alkaline phosphatase family protein [Mucilaginibacter xinganensis]|uniref:Phospholipase C n=1 Tax=Mucilaginibacter xinganensis TaxID=1234841 RepID=A0A223P011_9SPHI|nr:alkaline phosphatase family protein [Mucilaginibacter xinganensis]ASU35445.1 phospholipase C [Mucilaginibacter xinganensis]